MERTYSVIQGKLLVQHDEDWNILLHLNDDNEKRLNLWIQLVFVCPLYCSTYLLSADIVQTSSWLILEHHSEENRFSLLRDQDGRDEYGLQYVHFSRCEAGVRSADILSGAHSLPSDKHLHVFEQSEYHLPWLVLALRHLWLKCD